MPALFSTGQLLHFAQAFAPAATSRQAGCSCSPYAAVEKGFADQVFHSGRSRTRSCTVFGMESLWRCFSTTC
jgi:hypothetical protein